MKANQSRAPYYIKFHLGDYSRDADYLSLLQEGAYLRLMRWYYSTAKPIPNDLERIYRRCMAFSIEEQGAIRFILEEFFVLDGPVWTHKRIDEEIAEWTSRSDLAKGNAERRWKKPNKNNETTYAKAMPSHCQGNANQNQNQNQNQLKALSSKLDVAREILNFLNDKTGRRFPPVDSNLKLIIARLNEGHSAGDCRMVIARKWREWSGDEKMHQYARPKTLFNATNFNNYIGECVLEDENG